MSDARRPFLDLVRAMIAGKIPPPPIGDLIGMRVIEVEPGRGVFEMEASRKHANPMGTLHGGVLCDLADGAMGVAWASELGEGESFTTLELKINFLKPVWEATLRAEARVVRRGRTIGLVECDIRDAGGDLVARASSTCMTLSGDQAKGR
ncbi:MAG TPA: PaaI family thioesterase [Thermoanaerobaculia bacterium]|nr:PaaI family thioesterase [Thermoanaerobaculia bacterium]